VPRRLELATEESERVCVRVPAITISKEVLAQERDGETVLLDFASESYFGLDEISTRVWQMIQGGMSQEEMIDVLLGEYKVKREFLERDVNFLLARLSDAGLIRLA
jgi:hypothetical protein